VAAVTVPWPREPADDRIAARIVAVGRAHPSTAVRRNNDAVPVEIDPFVRVSLPVCEAFRRGARAARRAMESEPDPADRYAPLLAAVGRRVRAARETAGMGQLAAEQAAGLPPGTLAAVERGELPGLTVGDVARIADALGVDPPPLTADLRTHRAEQNAERLCAGDRWEDNGLVFCQPNGRPIDPRTDWDDWKALLDRAKVHDARVHDARHTAGTLLLVQGVHIRVVQEILGHSRITVTEKYTHVQPELSRNAAQRMGDALWG
jgi:integrase